MSRMRDEPIAGQPAPNGSIVLARADGLYLFPAVEWTQQGPAQETIQTSFYAAAALYLLAAAFAAGVALAYIWSF
jgi:hypothetical protein